MKKINLPTYRNIGIGVLIFCALSLIRGILKFLAALILLPGFYTRFLEMISAYGQYQKILFFIFMSLDTLLAIWGFVLSIMLIKNDSYNKQILYWTYSFVSIRILSFVLYLPLKSYMITTLFLGIVVYIFLVYRDNQWSRAIKNKLK